MLPPLIILCALVIIIEIIILYKTNKKQEFRIYSILTIILLIISLMEYFEIIPRHLLKSLSKLLLGNQ